MYSDPSLLSTGNTVLVAPSVGSGMELTGERRSSGCSATNVGQCCHDRRFPMNCYQDIARRVLLVQQCCGKQIYKNDTCVRQALE